MKARPRGGEVRQVAMSEGNVGCPHEEGEDFRNGRDCPFWKGKPGREGECGNPSSY